MLKCFEYFCIELAYELLHIYFEVFFYVQTNSIYI